MGWFLESLALLFSERSCEGSCDTRGLAGSNQLDEARPDGNAWRKDS